MQPAWEGYLADPFILRTDQGYFAYGTGSPDRDIERETGRAFPVLRSEDLRSWTLVGGALDAEAILERHFWAPEVCEHQGRFFMFYSAGGAEGEGHQIRIAVADQPSGPFEEQDRVLLPQEAFSIDASPFRDPATGDWVLFFAKDFLDGSRPGTGCAAVRMDMDRLEATGEVIPAVRASADWQVYERDRNWYDRTWDAWYTVEAPFCVFRDGRYWLFYSGGLWKGQQYGVGVATSLSAIGPYQDARGVGGPTVLKTTKQLRGPGHCALVGGPDGRDYIVFHAWDGDYEKRQMMIAELVWTEQGPLVKLES